MKVMLAVFNYYISALIRYVYQDSRNICMMTLYVHDLMIFMLFLVEMQILPYF